MNHKSKKNDLSRIEAIMAEIARLRDIIEEKEQAQQNKKKP